MPADHPVLLSVHATASCKDCGSNAVAWFRSPKTNVWALHDVVENPGPTVSGFYMDVSQPHRCPELGLSRDALTIWQHLKGLHGGNLDAMRAAWWQLRDELSKQFFRTVER